MSFVYKISPSGDEVRIVGKGKITTAQCIGVIERIMSDPRCHLDATAVVDLHKATYEPKDQAEVIAIGRKLAKFHRRLKSHIAIVAQHSTFFPAEMLASYLRKVARVGIKVFADIAAAEAYCRAHWHSTHGTT
jgi:hypothetical protein